MPQELEDQIVMRTRRDDGQSHLKSPSEPTQPTNTDKRKVMNSKLQSEAYEQLANKKYSRTGRKLARATAIGLVALAVCFQVRPGLASGNNPVTRPLIVVQGHLTITVDSTGAYDFTDWGWATHTGLYSNSGSGVLDLA